MLKNKKLYSIVGMATTAILFSAGGAYAQSTGGTPTGNPPPAQSADSANQNGDSTISKKDREFMEDIAHGNLAEIDTGKLALEKSSNEQVKKFAQMMIDDHGKAQNELQQLAGKKGVTLPRETDLQHKTIATGLKALSGNTFDNQYIARVGVGDHERTQKLLLKVQKDAQDADLKAYAAKTIKAVEHHLSMAETMKDHKK
jgi:putative membrane protein